MRCKVCTNHWHFPVPSSADQSFVPLLKHPNAIPKLNRSQWHLGSKAARPVFKNDPHVVVSRGKRQTMQRLAKIIRGPQRPTENHERRRNKDGGGRLTDRLAVSSQFWKNHYLLINSLGLSKPVQVWILTQYITINKGTFAGFRQIAGFHRMLSICQTAPLYFESNVLVLGDRTAGQYRDTAVCNGCSLYL